MLPAIEDDEASAFNQLKEQFSDAELESVPNEDNNPSGTEPESEQHSKTAAEDAGKAKAVADKAKADADKAKADADKAKAEDEKAKVDADKAKVESKPFGITAAPAKSRYALDDDDDADDFDADSEYGFFNGRMSQQFAAIDPELLKAKKNSATPVIVGLIIAIVIIIVVIVLLAVVF